MRQESIGKDQLFFAHVKKVAAYLKDNYPQIEACIVWDDMFRYAELSAVLSKSYLIFTLHALIAEKNIPGIEIQGHSAEKETIVDVRKKIYIDTALIFVT